MLVEVVDSVGVENEVTVTFVTHGAGVKQNHSLDVFKFGPGCLGGVLVVLKNIT